MQHQVFPSQDGSPVLGLPLDVWYVFVQQLLVALCVRSTFVFGIIGFCAIRPFTLCFIFIPETIDVSTFMEVDQEVLQQYHT